MVAVRAVYVAVRELFRRRRAHVEDRAIEAQPLSGQLVIAVNVQRTLRTEDVAYDGSFGGTH